MLDKAEITVIVMRVYRSFSIFMILLFTIREITVSRITSPRFYKADAGRNVARALPWDS